MFRRARHSTAKYLHRACGGHNATSSLLLTPTLDRQSSVRRYMSGAGARHQTPDAKVTTYTQTVRLQFLCMYEANHIIEPEVWLYTVVMNALQSYIVMSIITLVESLRLSPYYLYYVRLQSLMRRTISTTL